jgi:2-methylcitrate dehydratase PrpD
MTATMAFGAFSESTQWSRLPEVLRTKVKLHILDTIGVMCAGVEEPAAHRLQAVIRRWGGAPDAPVVGRDWRVPAPIAALLNTFHARLHVFDDTYDAGPVHPGSAVVAAALAAGATYGASGQRFLSGVLVGYEVATRVSAAISPSHYEIGFHNTGTCNVFGACAAAAHVAGLDAEATADALGLAGSSAAGFRQFQIDGSLTDTALHAARAAQSGVASVEMRLAGLSGPRGILDGQWGLCRLMAQDARLEQLTDQLGSESHFSRTEIKQFATCRFTHGPVETILRLCRVHDIAADNIADITIETFRDSFDLDNRPGPWSRHDAIFSHQFASAVAILRGRVLLGDLDEHTRLDARVNDLARRVTVTHNPALDDRGRSLFPFRVTLRLKQGGCVSQDHIDAVHKRAHDVGQGNAIEKFESLAIPVLGPECTEHAQQAVLTLESAAGLDEFIKALSSG